MRSQTKVATALSVALILLVGCTGSGGSSGKKSTLVVAAFNPFTGPDAPFGPEMTAGCYPGVREVNAAGGVLGHQLACVSIDTRGDPADAVPAASKLLATTSTLVGILGPSSDEADSTVPIFNQAKIPMFADTGEASFDHSSYSYFWRLTPADDVTGYAMALWGHQQGWTRGAAIFGNDITSQSNVPTLLSGITALGDAVAINEKIALDQASYRSEVERLIAARPQVIYTELDPQSAATFFSELKQLSGMIPVIGTGTTLQPNWLKAVSGSIGESDLKHYYTGENPYAAPSGPSWSAFNHSLLASAASVPNPSQWSSDVYSMSNYDAVIIMALAMTAAKSTSPSVYNAYIAKVTEPSPDAVVVHTFREGKQALASGKPIQFVGAGGVVVFDKWHNSTGGFEFAEYTGNGHIALKGSLSAAQIAPLIK